MHACVCGNDCVCVRLKADLKADCDIDKHAHTYLGVERCSVSLDLGGSLASFIRNKAPVFTQCDAS